MSDLIYQNYNNRCQGWSKPSSLVGPRIDYLSGYSSPAGSTTVVSINGINFFSYSTVLFGVYNPTVYFINSNQLQFYVPSTLNPGIYPIQVFNGSIPSNSVNYTIDTVLTSYWTVNSNGSISNKNSSMVSVSSFSRGAPNTIYNDYTVTSNDNWLICNSPTDITITLPSDPQYIGREIMMKNINTNTVKSSYTNINSLSGTTTDIIMGPMKWATLVYDGFYWTIMQGN